MGLDGGVRDERSDRHAVVGDAEFAERIDAVDGDDAFDVVVVQLGANETLMDVASKHLGTAKRFKDIMKWNGWSERETRRLKPGTEIKLQIPKKAAAPR
jgi:hypothetical protein